MDIRSGRSCVWKIWMSSRSLSCTCLCGRFSASCARISSTYAPRTPQKFGHNWQKIFSQNQVQKDSERTLISTAFLFAVNLLAEVVSIWNSKKPSASHRGSKGRLYRGTTFDLTSIFIAHIGHLTEHESLNYIIIFPALSLNAGQRNRLMYLSHLSGSQATFHFQVFPSGLSASEPLSLRVLKMYSSCSSPFFILLFSSIRIFSGFVKRKVS